MSADGAGPGQEVDSPNPPGLLQRLLQPVRERLPGCLVAATIAMAATFLSENYGGPTLVYALLFGMSLNFLAAEPRIRPGIDLMTRSVLRIGVALLGARIAAGDIMELGAKPLVVVVSAVILTILVGRLLASLLRLDRNLGYLTGGATAICGASAALAISSVLPRTASTERDTILTVVAVTTLSTVAMIFYPLLVRAVGFSEVDAGIFVGGTIHDVAQVVAAGHIISDQAARIATYTKLMRVAMLLPVVLLLAALFRRDEQGARTGLRAGLPGFLIAFVVLVVVNSLGLIPAATMPALAEVSRWCLVGAIAGVGVKTSFKDLATVGWRPVAIIVAETVFIAALVLCILLLAE